MTTGSQVTARLGELGLITQADRPAIERELNREFEKIDIPDFETAVRMVAAHMHGKGKFYIEIAVDPKTKEVGWTFEPTEYEQSQN